MGHPRLSAYIKTQNWLNHLGEYLLFPRDESEFKGGAHNYVDSVEEVRSVSSDLLVRFKFLGSQQMTASVYSSLLCFRVCVSSWQRKLIQFVLCHCFSSSLLRSKTRRLATFSIVLLDCLQTL